MLLESKKKGNKFMTKLSNGKLDTLLREKFTNAFIETLQAQGEDAHRTASNTITFPVVDEAGNEKWIVIKISVPKGERNGDPYDGYSMIEDFKMKERLKAEKAEEAAAEKAKKIAKDAADREAAAKAKENQKTINE